MAAAAEKLYKKNRGDVVYDKELGRLVVDHHDTMCTHAVVERTGDPILLSAIDSWPDAPKVVELPPLKRKRKNRPVVHAGSGACLQEIWEKAEAKGLDPELPFSLSYREVGPKGRRLKRRLRKVFMRVYGDAECGTWYELFRNKDGSEIKLYVPPPAYPPEAYCRMD